MFPAIIRALRSHPLYAYLFPNSPDSTLAYKMVKMSCETISQVLCLFTQVLYFYQRDNLLSASFANKHGRPPQARISLPCPVHRIRQIDPCIPQYGRA